MNQGEEEVLNWRFLMRIVTMGEILSAERLLLEQASLRSHLLKYSRKGGGCPARGLIKKKVEFYKSLKKRKLKKNLLKSESK